MKSITIGTAGHVDRQGCAGQNLAGMMPTVLKKKARRH